MRPEKLSGMKNKLEVQIGRLKFKNPVLLASGTAGDGQRLAEFFDINELGGLITKTLTFKQRAGNPPARICEVPGGLINSIGLQNEGVKNFVKNSFSFLKKLKTNVIVSIGGETKEEYQKIIEYLENNGGDFISAWELNLSCPNVKAGGLTFGQNEKLAGELVKKVVKITRKPVFVKLSAQSDYLKVSAACLENGATGLSLINTLPAMAIDIKTGQPKLGGVVGGLSGPIIKPVALACVYQVYQKLKAPIIASGGIFSAEDAREFLLAGAKLVAIGTATFVEPTRALQIAKKLKSVSAQ